MNFGGSVDRPPFCGGIDNGQEVERSEAEDAARECEPSGAHHHDELPIKKERFFEMIQAKTAVNVVASLQLCRKDLLVHVTCTQQYSKSMRSRQATLREPTDFLDSSSNLGSEVISSKCG
jgi:hypothetical protein